MSMLDAFFNKGFFKAARCKTLLKLTIPRIKLLRNRREMQIKQMRKDIAKLLETGQEATARIRVEHIIREENMMAAQEIIELFCELVAVRLPIIESQRECPLDLKEAISSICFAAPRCSDLPELQQVQMQFAGKYGKEFVSAASELLPDCGVNRQIIELLSVRAPSVEVKMKLLKEIAEEHDLEWDPDSTEAEFLKPHEDLLNGPAHFIGGSTLPLPKEKCDDSMSFTTDAIHKEHEPEPESDTGFDSLDLPEVPKVSLHPSHIVPPAPDTINPNSASSSEAVPTLPIPPPCDLPFNHRTVITSSDVEPHLDSYSESNVVAPLPSIASSHTPPSFTLDAKENKQFVPFVSPPPPATGSISLKSPEPLPSFAEPTPSLSQTKSEIKVDLDDVLAAAHTAAETAERAAAAARAAASLAQVRISELVTKTTGRASENESQVAVGNSDKTDVMEKNEFDQQVSHKNCMSSYSPETVCQEPELPVTFDDQLAHQPSRFTSLEDDPYFSYPNLFGRQNSNLGLDLHK